MTPHADPTVHIAPDCTGQRLVALTVRACTECGCIQVCRAETRGRRKGLISADAGNAASTLLPSAQPA